MRVCCHCQRMTQLPFWAPPRGPTRNAYPNSYPSTPPEQRPDPLTVAATRRASLAVRWSLTSIPHCATGEAHLAAWQERRRLVSARLRCRICYHARQCFKHKGGVMPASRPRRRRQRSERSVAREAKDILLKYIADGLRGAFPAALGLDLPPIVEPLPPSCRRWRCAPSNPTASTVSPTPPSCI